jgi:hypothetical protein
MATARWVPARNIFRTQTHTNTQTHNHSTTRPHNHTTTQPHNHITTQRHTCTQPQNHTTTQHTHTQPHTNTHITPSPFPPPALLPIPPLPPQPHALWLASPVIARSLRTVVHAFPKVSTTVPDFDSTLRDVNEPNQERDKLAQRLTGRTKQASLQHSQMVPRVA